MGIKIAKNSTIPVELHEHGKYPADTAHKDDISYTLRRHRRDYPIYRVNRGIRSAFSRGHQEEEDNAICDNKQHGGRNINEQRFAQRSNREHLRALGSQRIARTCQMPNINSNVLSSLKTRIRSCYGLRGMRKVYHRHA